MGLRLQHVSHALRRRHGLERRELREHLRRRTGLEWLGLRLPERLELERLELRDMRSRNLMERHQLREHLHRWPDLEWFGLCLPFWANLERQHLWLHTERQQLQHEPGIADGWLELHLELERCRRQHADSDLHRRQSNVRLPLPADQRLQDSLGIEGRLDHLHGYRVESLRQRHRVRLGQRRLPVWHLLEWLELRKRLLWRSILER